MKVFLLGVSGSGKSPLGKMLAAALKAQHIGASEWVRKRFKPSRDDLGRAEFIEEITQFSLNYMKAEPHASADFIRAQYDLSKPCVIEGIRNAFDLPLLFDPRTDLVVFLKYLRNELPLTNLESGIGLMEAQLKNLCQLDIMDRGRVLHYGILAFGDEPKPMTESETSELVQLLNDMNAKSAEDGLDFPRWRSAVSLEAIRDEVLEHIGSLPSSNNATATKPNCVHVDAPVSIPARVHAEYLHAMNPDYQGKSYACKIFAVSSYLGSVPTFKIILSGENENSAEINRGSLFSFVPPHAIFDPSKIKADEPMLELEDLVYHDSREGRIAVNSFGELAGPLQAFFVKKNRWLAGEYVLTVDWYDGNDLLHLVRLENGQFAMLPSHKLKFGSEAARQFAAFRKMKTNWSVSA